jgi:hypothetical protein
VIQCITGAAASGAEGNGSVEKAGSSSTWKPSFVGYDPEPDPRKMLAAVTKRIRRQGRQKALASKAEARSEQNEPPPTPYAQGDVSQVIEDLASEGFELFSKASDLHPTPRKQLALTYKNRRRVRRLSFASQTINSPYSKAMSSLLFPPSSSSCWMRASRGDRRVSSVCCQASGLLLPQLQSLSRGIWISR